MSKDNWEEIQALAAGSLRGDALAYKSFLGLISSRLKPRLRKVLPDSHVDDALQEILMAIHKSLHTLDLSKPIAPWLNAIAHYKIQDQLRAIYKSSENTEFCEENLLTSELAMLDGTLDLEKILNQLSSREREILKLVKIEEFSVLDVATKMNMTPSNVKIVAFRAVQKLRVIFSKEEFHENR